MRRGGRTRREKRPVSSETGVAKQVITRIIRTKCVVKNIAGH